MRNINSKRTYPYTREVLISQLRGQFDEFVESAEPLELWALTDVLMTRQAAYGYPEAGIVGAFHEFLKREERHFFATDKKELADTISKMIVSWEESNGAFYSVGSDWRIWNNSSRRRT